MDSSNVDRIIYLGAKRSPKWFLDTASKPPTARDGEVLVKVRLATICSNDRKVLAGSHLMHVPLVLGHEAVCEVIEDNRHDVKEQNFIQDKLDRKPLLLSPGTRIVFASFVSCSSCNCCRTCLPQLCVQAFTYGDVSITDGSGFNGCFATHLVLKKGTHIIPVPPSVSDKAVVPVNCALALVINAVEAARTPSNNETAIVQGANIHGLYACAVLKHKGYKRVICWDDNMQSLKSVKRFGGEPCVTSLLEISSDFADCCINVCGDSTVVPDGLSAVRCGGSYVLTRMTKSDPNLILTGEFVEKCITVKGVHGYLPRHLQEAMQFLVDTNDIFPYDDLISSRTYKLHEFEEAVRMANSNTYRRVAIQP